MGKACRKCGVEKPLEAFYQDRSRPDGRRNSCKECDLAHQKTPEAREHKRAWSKTDKAKAAQLRFTESGKRRLGENAYKAKVLADPVRAEQYRQMQRECGRRYAQSEKGQAAVRAYRQNPEKEARRKERMRLWMQRPEVLERLRQQARIAVQKRMALKRALPATFTEADWQRCLAFFDHRCAYCEEQKPLAQDHFQPLSAGGTYTPDNIVPACKSCNSSKHDEHPANWCSGPALVRILAYFSTLG